MTFILEVVTGKETSSLSDLTVTEAEEEREEEEEEGVGSFNAWAITLWTGLTCHGASPTNNVCQWQKIASDKLKPKRKYNREKTEAPPPSKLRRMGERADSAFNTTGSKWLLPVSGYLGFPLDQVCLHMSLTYSTAPSLRILLSMNIMNV